MDGKEITASAKLVPEAFASVDSGIAVPCRYGTDFGVLRCVLRHRERVRLTFEERSVVVFILDRHDHRRRGRKSFFRLRFTSHQLKSKRY